MSYKFYTKNLTLDENDNDNDNDHESDNKNKQKKNFLIIYKNELLSI